MFNFIEEGNSAQIVWGLVTLNIRSYLDWVEISQVATLYTHLGGNHTPSGVSLLNSRHKLSSSIIFLHFHYATLFLCSYTCYNSVFLCVLVLFFHLALGHGHLNFFLSCLSIFAMHHHYHFILIFLFAFGSEPSHLLYHLVKFVSSGDIP